jgi:predicted peptidase
MPLFAVLALVSFGLSAAADAKRTPSPPVEGQTVQPPVAEGGYPYLLFIPKSYNDSGKDRWPLVIFLHGSGERGTDINVVKKHGPPMLVEKNPAFPFIVISPQLPEQSATVGQLWPIPPLEAILDHALKTLRIDPSRVYLTGLSLGGMATWDWGTAHPDRFAALAPVAASGDPSKACNAKHVPVWAFHGDHDDAVDTRGDFEMVDALKKCGAAPRLTIYANTDHWSWVPAYNDPALWMWLLEQRKPRAADPKR